MTLAEQERDEDGGRPRQIQQPDDERRHLGQVGFFRAGDATCRPHHRLAVLDGAALAESSEEDPEVEGADDDHGTQADGYEHVPVVAQGDDVSTTRHAGVEVVPHVHG